MTTRKDFRAIVDAVCSELLPKCEPAAMRPILRQGIRVIASDALIGTDWREVDAEWVRARILLALDDYAAGKRS